MKNDYFAKKKVNLENSEPMNHGSNGSNPLSFGTAIDRSVKYGKLISISSTCLFSHLEQV